MSEPQSQAFADRLQRIARDEGHTNASLHIGMAEVLHGAAYHPLAKKRFKQRMAVAWRLPLALLSGGIAPILGHWIRVHLGWNLQGMQHIILDLLLTVGVMLCLWLVLRLYGRVLLLAQILAATLSSVFWPKLVVILPNLFAVIFSPTWVEKIIAAAPPL